MAHIKCAVFYKAKLLLVVTIIIHAMNQVLILSFTSVLFGIACLGNFCR